MTSKTFLFCFFTMVAFAANSVICRLALKEASISPLDFTAVRLISGCLTLLPILIWKKNKVELKSIKSFLKALPLFLYALFFSLAYIDIASGMGALILFAAVQLTMIGISLIKGNRLNQMEWCGFFLAFGGLVYLLLPGLSAPPFFSACLMLMSGVFWGVYSIFGKEAKDPIQTTAVNFLLCAPLAGALLFHGGDLDLSGEGFILAAISGSITSGLGYVFWYITLRKISTTIASVVQLSVPTLAAFGGVLFVSEPISIRLIISTIIIFSGIILTIKSRAPIKMGKK